MSVKIRIDDDTEISPELVVYMQQKDDKLETHISCKERHDGAQIPLITLAVSQLVKVAIGMTKDQGITTQRLEKLLSKCLEIDHTFIERDRT